MKRAALFAALALPLFAVACTAEQPSEEATTTTSEIQGGVAETGHPAIGLLSSGCTGTLITPTVVLTAGHCVASTVRTFTITVDGVKRAIPVAAQKGFPGYSSWGGCPATKRDLGLVKLSQAVTDVAPLAMADAPATGTQCLAVGYGVHNTPSGSVEHQTKRSATELVTGYAEHTTTVVWGDGVADHGDSGGPLLFGDAIVGTVSCQNAAYPNPNRVVHYERVDQQEAVDFINATIAAFGAPATATP
ncbi:MAG: trypsin-like serine protease [Labilithrix sp.]